jgi:hypothetical protein
MDESHYTKLWQFVRGDLPVAEFEAWTYTDKSLEEALGNALYWEVIAADYRSADVVSSIREQLRKALDPNLKCLCPAVPDLAIIAMGGDRLDLRFFATVREIQRHGGDLWWLYLSRCEVCGQNWMLAQEERIYDDYLLKRLTTGEAEATISDGRWPSDFLTYESVLEIARRLGSTASFVDPRSPALIVSVRDLKVSRVGITATEIAKLLGIEEAHAIELMKIV